MVELDYQKLREENIRKNSELLLSLGLEPESALLAPPPKDTSAKKQRRADKEKKRAQNGEVKKKKRTIEESEGDNSVEGDGDEDEEDARRPAKSARMDEDMESNSGAGTRRSKRQAGQPPKDYSNDGLKIEAKSKAYPQARKASSSKTKASKSRSWEDEDGDDMPRHRMGKRVHNPKTFGHIPGIPVGKWWELRMHCSTDAVHAPTVAGISGNPQVGAWSIALSGGYEDDVDMGEAFTFTGAGGRDLKGTKAQPKNLRTAPQSKDQSFETSLNGALLKSSKTRKPIRVIRGYKGAAHSKYAPASGYRYDGLYVVEKAWMERGLNKGGFKVCKFALKRLPGQRPIPVRSGDDDEEDELSSDEEEDETEGEEGGEESEGEESEGEESE